MKKSLNREHIRAEEMDKTAPEREKWIKKNCYYYKDLGKFIKHNVPERAKVLEIGCGIGNVLNSVNPLHGVGIDISGEMIKIAKGKYPYLNFYQMPAENMELDEKFDFIIISDTLVYFEDIQKVFNQVHKLCTQETRIILTSHNFIWNPFLRIAESLHLKMPHRKLNWLGLGDIIGLLNLENFDVIKKGSRFLFPKYFPILSWVFNKYFAHLPIIRHFCITSYIIARPIIFHEADNKKYSVSVIVPARNEKGNIENVVKRLPEMGKHTELIFVEGNSKDNTLEEIKRVCQKYRNTLDVKYTVQDGKGKGDAVRKAFDMATGDILMILDADLTVPPEDLPKFYNAIAMGHGEYINGTRLVYPMEKQAMRHLNLLGNKFFSVMFSWLLDQRIKDTLCGTKVISKKNYEQLVQNRTYFGNFDPFGDFDLIFGAAKMNLKFVEVPIRYRAREYGETNISRLDNGWLLLKMVIFAMNKIKFI